MDGRVMGIEQYVGQTFGKRTVLVIYPPAQGTGKLQPPKCDARCACGKIDKVSLYPLIAGISNQCRDCRSAARRNTGQLEEIRSLKESGLSQAAIARQLGVSPTAIGNLLKRARARL